MLKAVFLYFKLFLCIFEGEGGFTLEETMDSKKLFELMNFKEIENVNIKASVYFTIEEFNIAQGRLISIEEKDDKIKFTFFFPEVSKKSKITGKEKRQKDRLLVTRYWITPKDKSYDKVYILGLLTLNDNEGRIPAKFLSRKLYNMLYPFWMVDCLEGKAFYTRVPEEDDLFHLLLSTLVQTERQLESKEVLATKKAIQKEIARVGPKNYKNSYEKRLHFLKFLDEEMSSRKHKDLENTDNRVLFRYFIRLHHCGKKPH